MRSVDFLIIGAGIIGLTVARELRLQYPSHKILIVEKENGLAYHASGKNSGVLHSGIYYLPNSLKAKICGNGRELMVQYCLGNSLPYNKIGKIIVAINPEQIASLDELQKRSQINLVNCQVLDRQQINDMEPAITPNAEKALFLPDTAVVDPKAVMNCLFSEITKAGVDVLFNEQYLSRNANGAINTTNEQISFGHLINTAGLHADRIAREHQVGKNYKIVPFKGIYYRVKDPSTLPIQRLIYPVPDMNMPFLGVHATKSVDNSVYLGPNALPALSRENYHGLENIYVKEALSIGFELSKLYLKNKDNFRRFAHRELKSTSQSHFLNTVRKIFPSVQLKDLVANAKIGIRAQLLDTSTGKLVHDFLIEKNDYSTHILNAASPGFTSSLSFAKHIVSTF